MSPDLATVLTTMTLYAIIVVSPGPSFALISRMAVAGERRGALGATLGLALGGTAYGVLTLTGLTVAVSQIGGLAQTLQIAGGAYLVYLGVRTWLDADAPLREGPHGQGQTSGARDTSSIVTGARRGFVMCLSNPKAIAFFVGLYAAAVPPGTALWAKGAILLGAFGVEIVWYGLITLLLSGSFMRAWYARWRTPFERAMALILAAFGVRLITAER